MKILITGENGFLATEFKDYFSKGYKVSCLGRKSLDFTDAYAVDSFFNMNGYVDVVIHTAADGGKRMVEDSFLTFSNNIAMFSNLLKHKERYGMMFCFGSGAEYDRQYPVRDVKEGEFINCHPLDYYGLSKNIIAKEIVRTDYNIYNFRLFGCFGEREEPQRFIKNSMRRILEGKPVIIHRNIEMDFFYVKDLCTVIDFYIKNIDNIYLPKEVNMVYEEKLQLKEVANIIKATSGSTVPVATKISGTSGYYTGDASVLSSLGIPLKGLTYGIEEIYACLT